jgi:hypothetical protein
LREFEDWLQQPLPSKKLRNLAVSYGAPWQGPGYLVSRHSATWASGLVSVLVTAVTGLEELGLRGIKVSGESLEELSHLPQLVTLRLSHCGVASSAGVLQQVTLLTGLRSLAIEEGLGQQDYCGEGGDGGSSGSSSRGLGNKPEHGRKSLRDMVLDVVIGKLPQLQHLAVNKWAAKLTPIS